MKIHSLFFEALFVSFWPIKINQNSCCLAACIPFCRDVCLAKSVVITFGADTASPRSWLYLMVEKPKAEISPYLCRGLPSDRSLEISQLLQWVLAGRCDFVKPVRSFVRCLQWAVLPLGGAIPPAVRAARVTCESVDSGCSGSDVQMAMRHPCLLLLQSGVIKFTKPDLFFFFF